MQPNLDLSMDTIIKACKGNIKALPSFMVHDNAAWPWPDKTRLDSKNRIHMRRTTFLRTVAADMPTKPGIWHRVDVQEFHLDLLPHHLGGGEDQAKAVGHKQSRVIVLADKYGRPMGDQDHGDAALKPSGVTQSDLDLARDATGGAPRGVTSTVIDRGDSE